VHYISKDALHITSFKFGSGENFELQNTPNLMFFD